MYFPTVRISNVHQLRHLTCGQYVEFTWMGGEKSRYVETKRSGVVVAFHGQGMTTKFNLYTKRKKVAQ